MRAKQWLRLALVAAAALFALGVTSCMKEGGAVKPEEKEQSTPGAGTYGLFSVEMDGGKVKEIFLLSDLDKCVEIISGISKKNLRINPNYVDRLLNFSDEHMEKTRALIKDTKITLKPNGDVELLYMSSARTPSNGVIGSWKKEGNSLKFTITAIGTKDPTLGKAERLALLMVRLLKVPNITLKDGMLAIPAPTKEVYDMMDRFMVEEVKKMKLGVLEWAALIEVNKVLKFIDGSTFVLNMDKQ